MLGESGGPTSGGKRTLLRPFRRVKGIWGRGAHSLRRLGRKPAFYRGTEALRCPITVIYPTSRREREKWGTRLLLSSRVQRSFVGSRSLRGRLRCLRMTPVFSSRG